MTTETTESFPDELVDIAFAMDTDSCRLDIDTGVLSTHLKPGDTGGVGILQSGDMLMLIQGLHRDDAHANVGQDLSPDQARALGDALHDAADAAECTEPHNIDVDSEQGKTIIQRVSAGLFQE